MEPCVILYGLEGLCRELLAFTHNFTDVAPLEWVYHSYDLELEASSPFIKTRWTRICHVTKLPNKKLLYVVSSHL